eukprot:gene6623-331_t
MANLPNQTLYLKNLNDKIHKEELRRSLYFLFSQFGPIVDVVALKTPKMRGQAFIAFIDITCATKAMRALQSFKLFGKPMKITYAKSKSYAAMKEDGTFNKFLAKQRKRAAEKDEDDEPETKMAHLEQKYDGQDENDEEKKSSNKILYVSNLPIDITKASIEALFSKFDGLVEVRMIEGRPDICFVEYSKESQSSVAIQNLDSFQLDDDHKLSVTFAKK